MGLSPGIHTNVVAAMLAQQEAYQHEQHVVNQLRLSTGMPILAVLQHRFTYLTLTINGCLALA
jgi:TctA family transporter